MAIRDLEVRERAAFRAIVEGFQATGQSPSVRQLSKALGYKSPRSAAILIDRLIAAGIVERGASGALKIQVSWGKFGASAQTVRVPLVGTASCGVPLLAEENVEGFLRISTEFAPGTHRYFLLRASGDSMDKAGIRDGDLVLVRQQETATDGDTVVALIDDEAMIKTFRRASSGVVLQPRSSKPKYKPMLLTEGLRIQGVVVNTIPKDDLHLLEVDMNGEEV